MTSKRLSLVSAANSLFFPGLLSSLATAIASASGRYDYDIHVLDGGLTEQDWVRLRSILRSAAQVRGINVDVRQVVPAPAVLKDLPQRRGSTLTFARLVAPALIDVDHLVYLDSDVLCFAGVEAFWEALANNVGISAVRDPKAVIGQDSTARQLVPRSKRRNPYFNAGIIGMNAAAFRADPLASQIKGHLAQAHSYRFVDQTLLNTIFCGDWAELPSRYNTVLTLQNCGRLLELGQSNLHFVGACKPWLDNPIPFHRHAPNCLFDKVLQWLGQPPHTSRELNTDSARTGRRKELFYRWLKPSRAAQYHAALKNANDAAAVADEFWRRFGFPPLPLPKAGGEQAGASPSSN